MIRKLLIAAAYASALLATRVHGQGTPAPEPSAYDLVVLESDNGIDFGRDRLLLERANSPSIVRAQDGRLILAFQWFPTGMDLNFDRIAVMTSDDGGRVWSSPQPIDFVGLPVNHARPTNPSLVRTNDGHIRLYFVSKAPDAVDSAVYSALSSDGAQYVYEPGTRLAVKGIPLLNFSVARIGNTWHAYAPSTERRGLAYHAVSSNGLRFDLVDNIHMDGIDSWLGSVVRTRDGLRFYGTGPGGWSAVSRDGRTWVMRDVSGVIGIHPTVTQARDGRFVMVTARERPIDRVVTPPTLTQVIPEGERRIAANQSFVYVLHGDVLMQFDASSLRLMATTKLPMEVPQTADELERTAVIPADD